MFSKEEARQLRVLFWTSFGKSFPRKWILYNTKIKYLEFKFYADRKKALVCLDICHDDTELRTMYYDKFISLKAILVNEYLTNVIFEKDFVLEASGKTVSRIYLIHQEAFSIHNKNTWSSAFQFFNSEMHKFETFFLTYKEFIES
jgi:hypothetical protein